MVIEGLAFEAEFGVKGPILLTSSIVWYHVLDTYHKRLKFLLSLNVN